MSVAAAAERGAPGLRGTQASGDSPAGDDHVSILPGVREIWRRPLPAFSHGLDVLLCRVITTLARRWVLEIRGEQHIGPEHDPFVLALNHSQWPEAVLLPTVLIFLRRGHWIHFIADWNFLMIPGVGLAFRRSGCIIVGNKSARPRFLNVLKKKLVDPTPALVQAVRRLESGRPVGVFPEGTTNRDPRRLLRGNRGAARLALMTGVPLVPAGIRFPRHRGNRPIGNMERLVLEIGPPVRDRGEPVTEPDRQSVDRLHGDLMTAISELSGKEWS